MVTRQPHHGGPDDENRADDGGPCGDVAAYVLGVLDPAQHVAFSRHLAGCGNCQDDAAEFGVFVPVLRPALRPVVRTPFRVTRGILVVAAGVVVAVAAVLSVVESLSSHVNNPVERSSVLRAEPAHAEPFPLFGSV
ncbi:zf-HC2 domain-containing protein [Lentzea sp. NPDC059081]|uniref:zf-HC2 domain-containing protein n=1 Tax=Lentzea sp. NPDC059081 TaxID=3346719 RepID=UPI00369A7A82